MLDFFAIFTKGGIVLWCFQNTAELFTSTINELIRNVILQDRVETEWNHNSLALQYKLDNEFDLIFVVAYQNIIKLSYIDKFLTEIQLKFRDAFKSELASNNYSSHFSSFITEFDSVLRRCEKDAREGASKPKAPRKFEDTDKANKTVKSMYEKTERIKLPFSLGGDSSQPAKSDSGKKQPSGDDTNKENQELANAEIVAPRSPQQRVQSKFDKSKLAKNKPEPNKTPTPKGKQARNWVGEGNGEEFSSLDFSGGPEGSAEISQKVDSTTYVDSESVGKMKGDLKGIEVEDSFSGAGKKAAKSNAGIFSSLKSLVGAKVLSKELIDPVIEKMQEHLVSKNVAAEIAQKLCDNVAVNLTGKQIGTFEFVANTVKQALHESLVQILTPKKRIDILRDVLEAQKNKRPYVIVFCGVNGVGKSTNLAKVCFWLIENSFRVLIAACDTFRSGAVEQLKTHVSHLNAIHPPEEHGGRPMVQLYDKGYGRDAAAIAMEAINSARDSHIDVVLVDTAGRMQNNEPLMKALAQLINRNNPDLVLFVGEALVGNEAVDQVKKFNQALVDNTTLVNKNEQARTIDGIVLTKFDTIDDKVGAAISMTYTTGQPIVFVGTGQTYSDLKSLNADSVAKALLK